MHLITIDFVTTITKQILILSVDKIFQTILKERHLQDGMQRWNVAQTNT